MGFLIGKGSKNKSNPAVFPSPLFFPLHNFVFPVIFIALCFPCALFLRSCVLSEQATPQKNLVMWTPKRLINLCAYKPPEQLKSEQQWKSLRQDDLSGNINRRLFEALSDMYFP